MICIANCAAVVPSRTAPQWNGFWALLRYEDVVSALRQPETFITSVQNVVPKVAFTGRRPPLHFDPPDHTPYRRALNPFFTEKKMQRLEPAVRAITIRLLDPLIEAGGGEVCSEFTRKLPGHVFAEFFHLSPELAMSIKETSVVYNQALQEANDNLVKETSLRLYELARLIIEMRKAEPWDPAEDPTSALLQARGNDGEPLPENLVLGTIRQMIVVGMIAPSVMIGCILVHLAQHPEIERQLREEPDLIPAAVEEYLRLFTPYRGFARTAKHDVEFGGRAIHKDEPIALVYASANRDEEVFANPGRIHFESAEYRQAHCVRPGSASLRGRPVGAADAAGDAGGTSAPGKSERSWWRSGNDAVAGVGRAFGSSAS